MRHFREFQSLLGIQGNWKAGGSCSEYGVSDVSIPARDSGELEAKVRLPTARRVVVSIPARDSGELEAMNPYSTTVLGLFQSLLGIQGNWKANEVFISYSHVVSIPARDSGELEGDTPAFQSQSMLFQSLLGIQGNWKLCRFHRSRHLNCFNPC